MKLHHLVATGILAIAAAGAGYYAYSRFLHPPLVTTGIASLAPVSEAVYGTGIVEPERWAKVVPLQRRRLVELCKCEGQVVKSGQVLGRQDDAEERTALDQMEINRGQLERDLARADITPLAWVVNQSLTPLAVTDPVLRARRNHEAVHLRELAAHGKRTVLEPWHVDILAADAVGA